MKEIKKILAIADTPDPDNFFMMIALAHLFPEAELRVMLTGRPVRFGASKEHQLWEWDLQSSLLAQQASALRMKNFLRHFGLNLVRVYDGGIAPRTLVPHHVHFEDYYKFFDLDPLAAIRYNELDPQEDLIRDLLAGPDFHVVVGGPMTGMHQLLVRNPALAPKVVELHAMFATWGEVALMDLGGVPRGAKQFNVACDPQAAHSVLFGLDCPIYLMPTEVTRVDEIGFQNAHDLRVALGASRGATALYNLYCAWYDNAVLPRQLKNPAEKIFIHDLSSALSLSVTQRERIYNVVPIEITEVPYLPKDSGRWGEVMMKKVEVSSNRFAATGLLPGGAANYLELLGKLVS